MEIKAFTKHNPKHHASILNWPEEDSFKFKQEKDKTIITVADGITRDPLNLLTLPDLKTITREIEFAIGYPIPSPAKKAADLFCDSFIKHASKFPPCIKTLKQSVISANNKIKNINKNLKVDYLTNDFAACVASAAIMKNKTLYYAYMTDCGVAVFSKKGRLKFKTKLEGPNPRITEEIAKQSNKYGSSWRDPRTRARTRAHYRNNPREPLSYGALTGEKTALKFLRTGKTFLSNNDFVVLFTDGFAPTIFQKKFNISKHFQNMENYFEKHSGKIGGSEGTLVAIQT